MSISIASASEWLELAYTACGMNEENRAVTIDTVLRASMCGSVHGVHDIADCPRKIRQLRSKEINPNPKPILISSFEAIEGWDGDNGPGEIVCSFAMKRAMDLADLHGIGLAAVRCTNHFMAGGPYVQRAAEDGYIGIIICKAPPSVGISAQAKNILGSLPIAYAVPADLDYDISFDGCLSYASIGELSHRMLTGQSVPSYWGFDKSGQPTEDPKDILMGGSRQFIGKHKGFALSILGEVLTGLLSSGTVIDEVDPAQRQRMPMSHTAISINPERLLGKANLRKRAGDIVRRMESLAPGLRIPGQGASRRAAQCQQLGRIALDEKRLADFDALSTELGIPLLCRD